MKDSGVEWIGEIPSDWMVERAKSISRIATGKTPDTSNQDYFGGGIPWATIADLSENKKISSTKNTLSSLGVQSCGIKPCPKNSVLVSFKLSVGKAVIAESSIYTNEAIASFSPNSKILLGYLYWALPVFLLEVATENIYGAKILNQDKLRQAPVVLPPISEQQAIATYLDRETNLIDQEIALIERKVALLAEYRKAVIFEAVTKGLNKNATMKDSGVAWIGEVPVEWGVTRVKDIAISLDGARIPVSADLRPEGPTPYWGGGGISGSIAGHTHDGEIVLLGEDGAPFDDPSRDVAFYSTGKIWVNNHIHALRPTKVDGKFLTFSLNQVDYISIVSGSTRMKLTKSSMDEIALPYPPSSEQRAIAAYLERETTLIDQEIALIQRKATLLAEYRKALIFEAVTGKVEVPSL